MAVVVSLLLHTLFWLGRSFLLGMAFFCWGSVTAPDLSLSDLPLAVGLFCYECRKEYHESHLNSI
jgi:hypothetical protein